jgi:hypothetical protein
VLVASWNAILLSLQAEYCTKNTESSQIAIKLRLPSGQEVGDATADGLALWIVRSRRRSSIAGSV